MNKVFIYDPMTTHFSFKIFMNGSSFFSVEIMFASFTNGDIIKCSTTTNPCKVLAEWKCSNPQSKSKHVFLALEFETVITGCV